MSEYGSVHMKLIQIADFVSRRLTFKGRLGRLPYFYLIFSGITLFALSYLAIIAVDEIWPAAYTDFEASVQRTIALIGLILFFTVWTGFLLYFLCQSVRRLHDLNAPGWVYLFILIIFAGEHGGLAVLLFHLALVTLPGTKGSNKYGDQPQSKNK